MKVSSRRNIGVGKGTWAQPLYNAQRCPKHLVPNVLKGSKKVRQKILVFIITKRLKIIEV